MKNRKKQITVASLISFLTLIPALSFAMGSASYEMPVFSGNHGSGAASANQYQLSRGVLPRQPVGEATSENFQLQAEVLDSGLSTAPSCGIFIESGRRVTNNTSVNLNLICSCYVPDGFETCECKNFSISNNGFSWPVTRSFSLSYLSWPLTAGDGEKKVFVKYEDGFGEWSNVCYDSITLDTKPPTVSASTIGGTFMGPLLVSLTSSEPATIYYTTDDSEPTTSSTVYTSPINVTADVNLKFVAVDEAGNMGEIKEENYVVCNGANLSITGFVKDATVNQNVPLAVINLSNGQTAYSQPNGSYSFTSLSPGYYSIDSVNITAPGYATYQKEILLCKANETNDIVLTKFDTVFGTDTNSGYSADPVNTSTGNYVYEVADLEIPGIGIPFSFGRTYNSQDGSDGPLGYGWNHSYNVAMSIDGNGVVNIRWGDGKVETWVPDGGGGFDPRYGVYSTLTDNGDGTYTVTQKDMMKYNFNTSHMLETMVDSNGNTLTFTYAGNELSSITDTVGRTIDFSYDTDSRIVSILDPLGRQVTFSYDINGDLVSTTDLGGNATTYSYDTNHQMLTMIDPLGNAVVTNTYDEQRRVVSCQKDALGAQTLYSYDAENKVTQIVDPYGNISYHHFDDLLRLTQEEDSRGNSAYYAYDDRGNTISAKDKNGNETTYQYDPDGNVTIKTDPLGHQTTATYDANNNPLSKTDANGNTSTFTYDPANGNLLTITDPYGHSTTYTYDANGQVLTETDALGNVTTSQYDIYGNMTASIDALGNTSTFTYDMVGRKLSETHPLGRVTNYAYDNMDRLISITDALGNTSVFTFDANGNKTEHLDANGNRTVFAYDAKNHLISRTNPLNETEVFSYDLMDRRSAVTNPRGAVSTVVYDTMGNVIQNIDALGNQVRYVYDANGSRIKTIDAVGNITEFVYDQLNHLISTTNALGNTETTTYDNNGNKLTVTDALGNTTHFSYDQKNRLVTVIDLLANTTINTYDALGRLTRVTDAKGNQTNFTYDALGRLMQVTDAEGGVVTATYDALGNKIAVTDTRGNTTNYEYDVLNRLTSETDPLGNITTMNYDAVGNLVSLNNADGTTSYSYDQANRLVSFTYPDSTVVAYTHDENGNRLSVNDGMGITSYTYDLLDRLVSVTDPFGLTVGYTYDPNGNRTSTKYPGNRSVFYYFDDLNRLLAVEDWGGVGTFYDYDAVGRLVGKIMGNDATVVYTYDAAGRLTSKTDRDASDTIIASYTYTLDQVGNRTSMAMDQPLTPRVDFVNDSFTHNDGNQVVTGGGANFTHDAKGNRTEMNDGGAITQYAYNYDDLLTMVENGSNVYEYNYNSDGHRFSSIKDGVEKRYLLDINGGMEYVLAEMDGSNNVGKYYVYGDGLLFSVDATTGERLYYHYDPLGSTVAMTDLDGNITDKYAYLAFGELSGNDTTHNNPFTYVGQFGVMQEENGLYFMRARFYDPETKRFMSEDPVKGDVKNSQTLSPYLYVEGNPILFDDPTGESMWDYTGISISTFEGLIRATTAVAESPALASSLGYLSLVGLAVEAGQLFHGMNDGFRNPIYEKSLSGGYAIGYWVGGLAGWAKDEIRYAYYRHKYKNSSDSYTGSDPNEVLVNMANNDSDAISESGISSDTAVLYTNWDPNVLTRLQRERLEEKKLEEKKKPKSAIERWFDHHPGATGQDYIRARREDMRRERERERERQQRAYERLATSLSKHSVLVYGLNKLPSFNSGNRNRQGVYASK